MKLERLIPLFLMGIVGLCLGFIAANTDKWNELLTPLIASISVLLATTIAITNLQQSRSHELTKRTLDHLSKKPKANDSLFEARVKMNQIVNELDLHNHYDNYPMMKLAMRKLDKQSAETIIQQIDYYDHLALGVQLGIYDSKLVWELVSTTHCVVWREFWPVARHNQLASQEFSEAYQKGLEQPYSSLEKEALRQFGGDLLSLITPRGYFSKLHT